MVIDIEVRKLVAEIRMNGDKIILLRNNEDKVSITGALSLSTFM
jgi:hypothetical protein